MSKHQITGRVWIDHHVMTRVSGANEGALPGKSQSLDRSNKARGLSTSVIGNVQFVRLLRKAGNVPSALDIFE